MIEQDIKNSFVTSNRGLFQFDRENNTLIIEPPLDSGEICSDGMRTFFGMHILHCMALLYVNTGLHDLDNEMACQKPPPGMRVGMFNTEKQQLLADLEKQRRKELLDSFKELHGLLQSKRLEFECSAEEVKYSIGDLTLIDRTNDHRLYIIDKNKAKLNSISKLYWNILAADVPKLKLHDNIVAWSNTLLLPKAFSRYFSHDSRMSSDESTCFTISNIQRVSIELCLQHVSWPPVEKAPELSSFTTAVIKNIYNHFPAYGDKYAEFVAEQQRKRKHFKDTLDGLVKKHVSMLENKKASLEKTVEHYDKKIRNTSKKPLLKAIMWLQVVLWGSLDKRKQEALAKVIQTAYDIGFVRFLSQKLENTEYTKIESVLNEVQQQHENNRQCLLQPSHSKPWLKSIASSCGTTVFFARVRTMSTNHKNAEALKNKEMQQFKSRAAAEAA